MNIVQEWPQTIPNEEKNFEFKALWQILGQGVDRIFEKVSRVVSSANRTPDRLFEKVSRVVSSENRLETIVDDF